RTRPPRRASRPPRATLPPAVALVRLPLALVSAVDALAQHRLLDRLIRSRTWIAIVAFALIGIVALQLGLLKLNGGIGRALESEALLQRQNSTLSIENSELAAGPRVEQHAGQLGMSFATTRQLRFLSSRPAEDVAKAAAAVTTAARSAAARAAEASSSLAAGETSSATASSEAESSESAQASSSEASASASATTSQAQSSEAPSSGEAAGSGEAEPAGGEGESHGGEAESSPGTQPSAGG
ncbi:MAG: hypothetical protein JWM66_46, partial [Solirubrobacterales bacterium]|nr:hypothetical protein [Solirubrobacterales bacterium]